MSEEKKIIVFDGEDEYNEIVKAHEEFVKELEEAEKEAKTNHRENG